MGSNANKIILAIWTALTVGLLLYLTFVASPDSRDIAQRTFGLGIAASFVAIPLGSMLAWVSWGKGLIPRLTLLLVIGLLVVPVFLHVGTWDAAFGRLGWLSSTGGQVLTPMVSGWKAAAWIHGVAAAPQVALILLLGLSMGRREFEEQALLDTNRAGVFWHVTLRRLWPLIILSILWTLIVCSREIAATDLYQVGTMAEQIYLGYSLGQFTAQQGNWTVDQLASMAELNILQTVALITWLAVTAAVLFMRLSDIQWQADHQKREALKRAPMLKNGVGVSLLLLLIVIPIGNLFVRSCYFVKPIDGTPTPGYSLGQLGKTLGRAVSGYQNEFGWSILIACVSATVLLIVAIWLSWLARNSKRWQIVFVMTLAISCALPGPLIGNLITKAFLSVDSDFSSLLFNRTIIGPVLANCIFCWPLAPLIVWYLFRKVPNDVLESAKLEGANGLQRFVQFGLMGNLAGLAGCWLLTAAFCFGELSASQLVLPPGVDTIPRLMLGLLHAGVDEMTAGLTIVIVSCILVISLAGWGLIRLNRAATSRQ